MSNIVPFNRIESTPISSTHQLNETIGLSPIVKSSRRTTSSFQSTSHSTTMASDSMIKIQSKVHFGFVAVGAEKVEEVTVENLSVNNLWVEIQPFKGVFSLKDEQSMYLLPKSSKTFRICYKPSKTKTLDHQVVCLQVKQDVLKKAPIRFKITVLGFSGRSEVVPVDLPIGKPSFYELMCKNNQPKVVFSLKNMGMRTAFVRIILLNNNCERSVCSDVRIHPDQFLVQPHTEIVTVTVHILSEDVVNDGFILAVYSGEEKQRLRCKEYLRTRPRRDCIVDGIDLANLRITGSILHNIDKEFLGTEDLRVLKGELNITYIKLVSSNEVTSDWKPDTSNYKIRSFLPKILEIEEVDDDLATCIRRI